jgi:hypothetical protein
MKVSAIMSDILVINAAIAAITFWLEICIPSQPSLLSGFFDQGRDQTSAYNLSSIEPTMI